MTPPAVFGLSVLMSFVAFGIVTRLYIWPRLRQALGMSDRFPSVRDQHLVPMIGQRIVWVSSDQLVVA